MQEAELSDDGSDSEGELDEDDVSAGVVQVTTTDEILTDSGCIAYASSLRKLANEAPRENCPCGEPFDIEEVRRGTAIYLNWVSLFCITIILISKHCSKPLLGLCYETPLLGYHNDTFTWKINPKM